MVSTQTHWTGMIYNRRGISYEKLLIEDIWTSLISMDGLDLQVVIVYVGVYSKTICTRAQAARYVTCGSG